MLLNFIIIPIFSCVLILIFGWQTVITELQLLLVAIGLSLMINIGQFLYYHYKCRKLKPANQPKSGGIERM